MDNNEFKFPHEGADVEDVEASDDVYEPNEADETADDGGVEIEVLDDTPEADRKFETAKPVQVPEGEVTEEDLKGYSEKARVKVKKRLELFTRGYHDERRAKEAAERERQEAVRVAQALVDENNKLKQRVNKNYAVLAEQAKKSAGEAVERAKGEFKAAYEAGDSDALATAQENLTTAKISADRVANVKLPPLQPTKLPVLSSSVPRAPDVDQRAADWQKTNRWFNVDKEMTNIALGVHTTLVEQGVDPQSDAYYDAINGRMKQYFPDKFPEAPSGDRPRNKANVVSPVTRSVAPRKITLTKTQVSLAKKLGVPLELYAKQVAEEMRKNHG